MDKGLSERAAQLISSARHVVALTGAGISTPSGVPDFRSPGTGLWTRFDPRQVISLTTFKNRPEVFYNWLRPLAKTMWSAKPNPAHLALAELEKRGYLKAVITQNIDGLHQAAGSQHVIEVHGSLNTVSCLQCRLRYQSSDFYATFITEGQMPRCPTCRAVLKPDVVLFEEMLPTDAWEEAEAQAAVCDVMLVVGSSLEVTPAAYLPHTALASGADLIINTLSSTHLDEEARLLLPIDVTLALPEIARQIIG